MLKKHLLQDSVNALLNIPSSYVDVYKLRNLIKSFANKKDVIVSHLTLIFDGKILMFNTEVYYKTRKLLKYKKRLKRKKGVKTTAFSNASNPFLIKISNLNMLIHRQKTTKMYVEFKKFEKVLFARSLNLFMDFLKVSSLLEQKKINANVFLYILGQVFKNLHKKKHSRFISFIKVCFDYFLKHYSQELFGLCFIISGRLRGKPRSSVVKVENGVLNLNTINSKVQYCQLHVYTWYGAFGLKLWINYK